MKATVQHLALRGYKRVIAISDIHGSLAYLNGLLDKVDVTRRDALVFVGDMVNKGPDSLAVLWVIMRLVAAGNAWAVAGNGDRMYSLLEPDCLPDMCHLMNWYRDHRRSQCLLWDMCHAAGLQQLYQTDPAAFQRELLSRFADEWAFLRGIPTVIESEDCIFVHAAQPQGPQDTWLEADCVRYDAFGNTDGPRFEKACIVGHWPVMLYSAGRAQANPVYNARRNIFSIDGGCMLKDDGQLNALIRDNATGCWSFTAYDGFARIRALSRQVGSANSVYIRWGDAQVEVLEREGEFSRCRHLRTGYVMDVLTDDMYHDSTGALCCDDSTDYRPPVQPGDELSLVRRTSRGCRVKKNGVSGWYTGEYRIIAAQTEQ